MIDENSVLFGACGSRAGCTFQVVDGSLGCVPGTSSCQPVSLLDAEESAFHDSSLIEATRSIKEILAKLPQPADGCQLSFIHTNMGTLLAWVNHGADPVENAVTADDDDATIAAALRLKNVSIADVAQAS